MWFRTKTRFDTEAGNSETQKWPIGGQKPSGPGSDLKIRANSIDR